MYYKNRYGLIGHWAMRGNAKDSTIYKNNGVVSGAQLVADRFGREKILCFNGTSYIVINRRRLKFK